MGMAKKTMDLDHAGPFLGKIFLVIIDSYSKWLEVVPVSSADTLQTVTVLRRVFSTHGIPEMIVSDNGAAFTSSEFEEFTKRNGSRAGIRHEKNRVWRFENSKLHLILPLHYQC